MKVMVTGATGFLGQNLVSKLNETGVDVVSVARKSAAETVFCNLHDVNSFLALLDGIQPDVIVNCAAQVDWREGCLSALYAVNTLIPAVIADWCNAKERYLLQVSGTLVYGTSCAFVESCLPDNPDTDYGQSKLLADQMIQASGAAAAVMRFGGIFSGKGPEHLGINRAIRDAQLGAPPTVYGEGLARRNYIHVSDAVDQLVYCIQNRLTGIHLAGGSEVLSIREMLQTISDVYLNGQQLVQVAGSEASDQIIVNSKELPLGRSFKEALLGEL